MELIFEWDEEKAATNLAKHKISFDDARTVFADTSSITIFDRDHSVNEDRYIDIGLSRNRRLLVVVYTDRNERIRIISCRMATTIEQRQYERNKR